MIYGSVCSGIEAASVAWGPLGWEPRFFAEIEPFPSAVLAHRFPGVLNLGDFTKIGEEHGPVELLVGGTPCQSFSVAGKRLSLDDPRGNLSLEYLALARRLRPAWLVFENVPGLLSSDEGRDFGAFLGTLGELGYGFAYRVLDAQHFGVPQRRRRVFVVGHLGAWGPPAAVLLERSCLLRNPPASAGEGEGAPAGAEGCAGKEDEGVRDRRVMPAMTTVTGQKTGFSGADDYVVPVAFHENQRGEVETSETLGALKTGGGKPGRGYPAVAYRVHGEHSTAMTGKGKARVADETETARSLDSCGGYAANQGGNIVAAPVAFQWQSGQGCNPQEEKAGTQVKNQTPAVMLGSAVRRLTPRECERLQGFPDDWTLVPVKGKPAADGPRYKAIGNSMAVPVMRWIGERITAVEKILEKT